MTSWRDGTNTNRLASFFEGLLKSRSEWQAEDHGYKAWSYDPISAVNTSIIPVAGTVHTVRLRIAEDTTISNVILQCVTAGATLTSGQCFAAIFQSAALLGVSATQHTNWQSTGTRTSPLVGAPINVTAGDLYVGFFANGTTLPTFARASGTATVHNSNLAAASSRFGSADTGRTTTMPNPLGTIAASSISYWAAVS